MNGFVVGGLGLIRNIIVGGKWEMGKSVERCEHQYNSCKNTKGGRNGQYAVVLLHVSVAMQTTLTVQQSGNRRQFSIMYAIHHTMQTLNIAVCYKSILYACVCVCVLQVEHCLPNGFSWFNYYDIS